MAFEKFTKTAKSYEPVVSIRKNGQLGFSQGAYEKLQLEQYKYAVLFYDRQDVRIGIKLTTEKEEGVLPLRVKKTNSYIAAKTFLDFYDIPYKKETQRFHVSWDPEERMVILNLRQKKA